MLTLKWLKMQHSFSLSTLDKCSSFFLRASVWTITQRICQCSNSGSNICLLSIVEKKKAKKKKQLGTALLWIGLSFRFYTQPKKETGFSGFISHLFMGSCRNKQLFCVALHLHWVLLISSCFTLVIYDTATVLHWIEHIDCRASWGCLPSHWVGLMFNRLLFG